MGIRLASFVHTWTDPSKDPQVISTLKNGYFWMFRHRALAHSLLSTNVPRHSLFPTIDWTSVSLREICIVLRFSFKNRQKLEDSYRLEKAESLHSLGKVQNWVFEHDSPSGTNRGLEVISGHAGCASTPSYSAVIPEIPQNMWANNPFYSPACLLSS